MPEDIKKVEEEKINLNNTYSLVEITLIIKKN